MKTQNHNKQYGFTLIEIAVVMVIVGLLVGSFIGSITSRIETTRRDNTESQLEEIKLAITGFALANGRIPCPARTTSNGQEAPVGGGACTTQHGFIPGRTLGISGEYNLDGLLIDSWKNPIRYSVTTANANAFTSAGGMAGAGVGALVPDIRVCDDVSTVPPDCDAADFTITSTAPFIILSLGSDGSDFVTAVAPNSDQGENSSELAVAANAAGENVAYTIPNDLVFVSKTISDANSAAGMFDDIIVWESQYVLYSKMMEAGQLP